jgi:phosphatidate cytidylyltransferase
LSNLTVRIIAAVVGIPLILLMTSTGGVYFFCLVAVISAIALNEYYGLAHAKGIRPQRVAGLLFGFVVSAVFFGETRMVLSDQVASMGAFFFTAFLVFVPLMLIFELFRNNGSGMNNLAVTVSGVCYISLGLGSLVGLREMYSLEDSRGAHIVVALFVSIWVCDSAAYFVGRSFGRHKLFERVSPNKTWEGAIAGFVGALVAFCLVLSVEPTFLSLTNAAACGAIAGVFGQLGDMVESLLKRDAGMKDSSSLIPGHGGMLDRFDSVILASPAVFIYLTFFAA